MCVHVCHCVQQLENAQLFVSTVADFCLGNCFFSFLNGYTNVQYAEQVTSVFSELVYCK